MDKIGNKSGICIKIVYNTKDIFELSQKSCLTPAVTAEEKG
jgi:hypothetical protein